jgi:Gp19/Gp15/Gp42-like protein
MSNPVTVEDLEARWRPLTDPEKTTAQAFLDDAWALLKSKVPNLDALAAADPDLFANVVRIESQMVLRVLKNPDGTKTTSLSIDDATRTWTKDASGATGLLYVTDDELQALYPDGESGAFTIRAVAQPFCSPCTDDPRWIPVC